MHITLVKVYVKIDHVEDFIKATVENHKGSITENGNIRFDVLQTKEASNIFYLYEVYDCEESAKAHKKTEHYLKWRETVADWMEKSREGIGCHLVEPKDKTKW